MTPQFLLQTPDQAQAERSGHASPAAAQLATATARPRITSGAAADQALVAVLGLSDVGLPSALALRRAGFRVVGIDTSASRLNDIRSGRADLLGVSPADLRSRLGEDGFALTDKIEAIQLADMVLICVPTTVDAHGRPDTDALMRTCAAVVAHARAGQTLVLTSTTYVGCTRELLVQPLAERGLCVGEDVFVAFSAQALDPGVPADGQPPAPRVLGAVTETCFRHAAQLLRPICRGLHRVSSPAAAEMVRLYASSFHAVNIALAFEMADACRSQALDPGEIADAAATMPSSFIARYPAAGVSGHSVGVEPHYLLRSLREHNTPALLAEEAMRIIAVRPYRVAMRAHELLLRSGRALRELRVLVVGVAYEPGVADADRAPVVEIVSRLQYEGVQVDFHDPLVSLLRVDGEDMHSVEPDPRRDASGFGPEDYELAIILGIRPGHDYGWLERCPQVLDCTYRERAGRRQFLL